MSFRERNSDMLTLLRQVLPEYKVITEAPTSIQELPGYPPDFTSEELSRFEAVEIAEERKRRYKAADANGNVYLIANPWTRHIETRSDGTCWITHPHPKLVMSYAEAKRQAAELTVRTTSSASVSSLQSSTEKKKSQTDLDY